MPISELSVAKLFGRQWGGALDGRIRTKKLEDRYVYHKFRERPLCVAPLGAGAATGSTGDTNLCIVRSGVLEYHVKGTQTILGPTIDAYGMNITQDLTNNDGVEYTSGITALSPGAFTVGTDPEWFFRLKLRIPDVSGSDDLCVGFRKAEAYQAAVDDYDEGAWLQMRSGDIYRETILNNGATASVDTGVNWADGETHELMLRVNTNRYSRFYIDGVDYSQASTHRFDAGEVLVPFFFFLNDSEVAEATSLIEWEAGAWLGG